MSTNIKFYKIELLKKFVAASNNFRQKLLDELIDRATDPVILQRRYRMLEHVNAYESQIIRKIKNFETDDAEDLEITVLIEGLMAIANRSA